MRGDPQGSIHRTLSLVIAYQSSFSIFQYFSYRYLLYDSIQYFQFQSEKYNKKTNLLTANNIHVKI